MLSFLAGLAAALSVILMIIGLAGVVVIIKVIIDDDINKNA